MMIQTPNGASSTYLPKADHCGIGFPTTEEVLHVEVFPFRESGLLLFILDGNDMVNSTMFSSPSPSKTDLSRRGLMA